MKNTMLLCAMLAALIASVGARAADSVELKVSGTVRPAACILTLGANGTADYGHITNSQLSASAATSLGPKTVPFVINCPNGAAKLGLTLTDNRKASVVTDVIGPNGYNYYSSYSIGSAHAYGLGTVRGKNLGAYLVQIDTSFQATTPSASTTQLYSMLSGDGGKNWQTFPTAPPSFFREGEIKSWSIATANKYPEPILSMNGTLTVRAVIEKLGNLPTGDNIPLDGSATLEMIYF